MLSTLEGIHSDPEIKFTPPRQMLLTEAENEARKFMLYQYSLLGRQMEHVINLLNSPVIGKKSSFSFVLLLTGLGIRQAKK